jgi:GlpG protein
MRVIGILSDIHARKFSAFLTRRGIENRLEASGGAFQIWVADEDRLNEADELLRRFDANPSDPFFDVPILEQIQEEVPPEPIARRMFAPVTSFFVALCAFIYLLNTMQEFQMREKGLSGETFLLTQVQSALLFDLPPPVEKIDAFVKEHQVFTTQQLEENPELKSQLEELQKTPYWKGVYDWTLLKAKKQDTSQAEGPLFSKIREGEIWRLFSPCVLHRDLLHILFNMIWLWVLGRPIEQRIGPFRTLLLTLTVGILSNTVQYLMSGPLFLGYSGVVMGLAGLIWMRERKAPWEGYPLQRGTILFLAFFVLAMFVLQSLSFFVQIFTNLPFILSIANTAHIIGALIGALLGRLSFFARNT